MHLLLLLGLLAASQGPRIDDTFPPPDDRRRPDRTLTLTRAEGGRVSALAFTPDGRTLATASEDGRVRLWSARTGKGAGELLRTLPGTAPRGAQLSSLALSPDGLSLVALTRNQRRLTWQIASGELTANERIKDLPPGQVASPVVGQAIGGDGKLTASLGERGTVRVTDLATGALVKAVETWPAATRKRGTAIVALAISRKGGELATAGADGAIRVWDVQSGTLLATQQGHVGPVLAVAFNPNGQKMVSSGRDGSLRTWTVPLPPLPAEDLAKIQAAVPERASRPAGKPRKLLVFWRADAILHKAGVPAANAAIALIGRKTGAFVTHFSRDYEVFDPAVLAGYDALVLNSTAHINIPDEAGRRALLDYVRGGGGVVGIHAAIDMFRDWPEGAKVVGATFAGHPWNPSGTWAVKLESPDHPLLRAWGGQGFKMKDEFYELGEPYNRGDRRVLMSLDLSDAATAGVKPLHRSDRDFAVSWIKRYGRGRVFYCMFGHIAGPFHDARVQRYYLDGIQYALGDLPVD